MIVSSSNLIGEIYYNETLDDILKRVSVVDPVLQKEISLRIDIVSNLSTENKKDEVQKTSVRILNAAEAMEFFCDEHIEWIKKENGNSISYYVSGFCGDDHPKKHLVEIKNQTTHLSNSWLISICYGDAGKEVLSREYVGRIGSAKNEAISMVKKLIKDGAAIVV